MASIVTRWSLETLWAVPGTVTFPLPPSCTPSPSDCAALSRTYTEVGIYIDNCTGITSTTTSTSTPSSSSTATTSTENYSQMCETACTIQGSAIQVMYFPATTTVNSSRDLCEVFPTDGQVSCPYGTMKATTMTCTDGDATYSCNDPVCVTTYDPFVNISHTGAYPL